uniref:Z-DNA-binding protein 1 n=1 Tax=Sus scrofa TaxID=9823 RepID=A0A480VBW0_PIG
MESEQATVPKAPRLPAAAADVAETPADPEDAELERRILQVLRDAGSPVRTAQLVIKCQVPKKKLNQVLHRMKKESRGGLTLVGPATWCLGDAGTDGTREVVLAEQAERPRQEAVAIPRTPGPRTPGPELSERQTEIYRLLKAQGPHKALHIAQALGLKTAKEVNRDLYAMRNMHLLTLDQKSNAWGVYQPGRPLPAAHTWTGQRGRAATRNRKTQHLALAGLLPTSPLPAPPRHPPPRAACCGPGDRSLRRGFQEGRACWRRNQGRGLPGGVAPS